MDFNFIKPIVDLLFKKKDEDEEYSEDVGNRKALFTLEGTNADGDYIFVSKNELPGRSCLHPDGSIFFLEMPDPDAKETLDESDRRLFFSVKFFVQKEEFDRIRKDVKEKEDEIERLLKKKKDLEFQINELHKENEKLAAIPRREREIKELEDMKENPVYVETVAQLSGSNMAPDEGMEALETSRKIILDYEVTGLDEADERELADIVTVSLAQNVNKVQYADVIDRFMQGEKTGDAETYLRLAAFVTCVPTIREHRQELANLPNKKELNQAFMERCAELLRERNEDASYDNLPYAEKLERLIRKMEPAKQEYAESIEGQGQGQAQNTAPSM